MPTIRTLTAYLAFFALPFFSCKKSEDIPALPVAPPTVGPADATAITKFIFLQSDNHFAFGRDITTSITADSILISIPRGTDITKLIPTITIQGKTVQPAGGTATDFSVPITYMVTDNTGKTKSYIVKLSLSGANEVIIADDHEYAYDLTTGQLIWMNPTYLNMYYSGTASDGKNVFSSDALGNVYALDVVTGDLAWMTSGLYGSTRTPAVSKGFLYLSGGDQGIRALDAVTGNIIWNKYYNVSNQLQTMDAYNGALYFIPNDNRVYSVNTVAGTLNWQTDPSLVFVGSPTIASNTIYVSGYDSNVYALDVSTGNVKWKSKTGFLNASPAVADGVIYVASTNDTLYAMDAGTGKLSWVSYVNMISYPYVGPSPISSSPVAANGMVFVNGSDANLHAFDSGTGAAKWAVGVNQTGLQLVYLDGVVYTGSFAINASSGSIIWTGPSLSPLNTRFTIIANDGTVYNPIN